LVGQNLLADRIGRIARWTDDNADREANLLAALNRAVVRRFGNQQVGGIGQRDGWY
jgi:hypothetical protein